MRLSTRFRGSWSCRPVCEPTRIALSRSSVSFFLAAFTLDGGVPPSFLAKKFLMSDMEGEGYKVKSAVIRLKGHFLITILRRAECPLSGVADAPKKQKQSVEASSVTVCSGFRDMSSIRLSRSSQRTWIRDEEFGKTGVAFHRTSRQFRRQSYLVARILVTPFFKGALRGGTKSGSSFLMAADLALLFHFTLPPPSCPNQLPSYPK